MNQYLIGAGAVLEAGEHASIARATLHAQIEPLLAGRVGAALLDLESASVDTLSRVVLVAAGWDAERFETEITRPLLARQTCTLAEVLQALARATRVAELHLFARWLPPAAVVEALAREGVRVLAHPPEAIERASLVSGGRLAHWAAPLRAA